MPLLKQAWQPPTQPYRWDRLELLPAASPTALQQPLVCSQPHRLRVRAQQLLLRPHQQLLRPVRRLWQAAAAGCWP